ncbi:hypothetical protein FFV08_02725 [Streptococcus sanguinis]|uniref:DUF1837 domain-containing protein n=1 Tax=Streptococcus sanguinis TaxID=1305 RepID=A0A7H8V5A2_STRSA|nr:hypothetical protein FFV08_02725 [Streptococcus sanguinis]
MIKGLKMTLLKNIFEKISSITTSGIEVKSLSEDEVEVIVAEINSLNPSEKDFIKNKLVEISKGRSSSYTPNIIAKKIYDNLFRDDGTLKDSRIISGFAAEFFLICILIDNGFEQQFCYKNLEENSAKKGFDGLYQINEEIWLVESKSTQEGDNISHKTTIKRAYDGITDQLAGKTKNDPWENAANHAKSFKSSESLIHKLEQLSIEYTRENYKKLSECNLIIGSTVIHKNTAFGIIDSKKIDDYLVGHQVKNEKVVAMNLSEQDLFVEIMKEIANVK